MGFLLSPKVEVNEIDLTNIIPAVATTDAAYAGLFRWGPLNQRTSVPSEKVLEKLFGKPDGTTYEHFMNVANYLSYAQKMRLVRIAKETQSEVQLSNKLSTTVGTKTVTVAHASHGLSTNAVITISGFTGTLDTNITAAEINGRHTITVINSGSYSFTVATNVGAAGVTSEGGVITVGTGDFALNATSEKTTGSGLPGEGVLIKNEDHYEESFINGEADVGMWTARFPGKLGNSLKVSLCPSASAFEQTLAGTLSSAIKATGTLTLSGNPSNADTVTIDSKTYTFQSSLTNSDGNVKIGATASDTIDNLIAAITVGTGAGSLYAAATIVHPTVTASAGAGDTMVVTAKTAGTAGNSIATTESGSGTSFGAATLSGGTNNSTTITGSGTSFTTRLIPGSILVHPVTAEEKKVLSIASNTSLTLESAFSTSFTDGTVVAKWEYNAAFGGVAPGTSPYALAHNSLNDEVHIIVIDEDGSFPNSTRGAILERFAFVSLMGLAKTQQGESNYYKNVINTRSSYIWWTDKLAAGTNWGTTEDGTTFTNVVLPSSFSLSGGLDGNTSAATADFQRGYDLFAAADQVDVSVLIAPPSNITLAQYIVQNICEVRKDCVAVISPSKSNVVSNPGDEIDDIKAELASLSASSYAIVDNNWGYQYDRYNDTYRFVPCNAHIAGLMARVDNERDPWWSPAGLIYGHLKNVIKLAWNATEPDRDDLYQAGVNSIINIPGQGVVLFGDKTYLNRPSAFDRINVRRLFIVLEKAIATASKFILFSFNDEITRAQFRNLVRPFLAEVKGRRGIYDFQVVCDESNNTPEVIDRNEFVGDIYIKPARSINGITLNFVAVRTGVQFSEVVGQF